MTTRTQSTEHLLQSTTLPEILLEEVESYSTPFFNFTVVILD